MGHSIVLDFPGNVPRQREWFRDIFDASGADHVLHFVDKPDAVCKSQLEKRNIENPAGSRVMSNEGFDHITSFFEPPTEGEFNIVRYTFDMPLNRFGVVN
jgi:predicted kinase